MNWEATAQSYRAYRELLRKLLVPRALWPIYHHNVIVAAQFDRVAIRLDACDVDVVEARQDALIACVVSLHEENQQLRRELQRLVELQPPRDIIPVR